MNSNKIHNKGNVEEVIKTEKYTTEKSNTLFTKYCNCHGNFLCFF